MIGRIINLLPLLAHVLNSTTSAIPTCFVTIALYRIAFGILPRGTFTIAFGGCIREGNAAEFGADGFDAVGLGAVAHFTAGTVHVESAGAWLSALRVIFGIHELSVAEEMTGIHYICPPPLSLLLHRHRLRHRR